MGAQLAFTTHLESIECGGCGTTFAINSALYRQWRENGASVRCPNPACKWKEMVVTESEVAKLTKQLADSERRLQFQTDMRRAAEAETARVEKARRRLEKRVANGVCPCCQRSFVNLRRHIAAKHPDFTTEAAAAAEARERKARESAK